MDNVKQITLRIEMNLYEEIKKLSEVECRTVSQQVEYMLKKFMEIKK